MKSEKRKSIKNGELLEYREEFYKKYGLEL
jgi:queuine/archaeosine tRNA-ribosyltransferase